MLGVDSLGTMEPGAVLRTLKNAFPGAGHIAVLHGEGPAPERLTGRDGEVCGVAAFGVFYEVGLVQHLYPFEVTAPSSVGRSVTTCHTRSTGQEKWTLTLEVGINSPLLRFLVQLQADAPAVRRLLEQFHGDKGQLLDGLSGQLRSAVQVSHHGL